MLSAERVVAALLEEWSAIDELLSGTTDAQWRLPSPCPGWSVRDLASHIIGAEFAAAWEGDRTATTDSALAALAQPARPDSNDGWVRMLRTAHPQQVLKRLRTVIRIREAQLRALTGEQFARQVPTPAGPRRTSSSSLSRNCGGRVTHEEALRSVTLSGDRRLGTKIVAALPYTP